MPKFNKGDLVTLSEKGKRHIPSFYKKDALKGHGSNPWGIMGKVLVLKDKGLPIKVSWSNGTTNVYLESDLELFNDSLENK